MPPPLRDCEAISPAQPKAERSQERALLARSASEGSGPAPAGPVPSRARTEGPVAAGAPRPHHLGAMEILAFEAAGRRGALPAGDVREIVRRVEVLPLPDAPAGVEGAITVRGAAVPVVDLGSLLGGSPRPPDPDHHL